MTERDALMRAVCENPDDDLPRLVFADWLDENGEPDRAEFIRVQCELARSSSGARNESLKAREAALLGHHRKAWLEPFARFGRADIGDARFRRGFVHGLEIDDDEEEFSDYADELFQMAPIQRISFVCAYRHAKRAGCPALLRLRELGVDRAGFEAETLAELFASPYLKNIERLELIGDDDNGHLGEEALRLLSRCDTMPALRELDASYNWEGWQYRDEGWVSNLMVGDLTHQLTRLSLRGTFMEDRGAGILAGSDKLHRLTRLDLSSNSYTAVGLRALIRSPWLGNLHTLDLRQNRFDPDEHDDNGVAPEPVRGELIQRFGNGVLLDGEADD